MNLYLQEVFSQTADGGYFDFARCQRDDGTIYASPTDTCRKGTKIDDDVPAEAKKAAGDKKMQLTAKIKAMSADDLRKIADDPRLSDRQKRKLNRLIKAKGGDKIDKVLEKQPTERDKYRADLRKAQKEDAPKAEKQYDWIPATAAGVADLKNQYSTMQKLYKSGPPFDGPANRARMINMRLEIYKREREMSEKSAGPVPADVKKAVESSPKYDKTPGSTKPIAKPSEADVSALTKQRDRLSKALDDEKDPEKALKISQELLEVGSKIHRAQAGAGAPDAPSLKQIYKEQGFDPKPELVATANDLRSRKDLMMGSNGQPVIMYRGVTTSEFSDQFKGRGPDGDTHYPGRGIFGNGTYAAAASDANPGATAGEPIKTAKAYVGAQENFRTKITAFALRKDANVATFPGKEQSQREVAYDKWFDETIERAQKETGYRYKDVGEAAAALGYHAYQVPQRSGEDFYVVLNRGAVVAAMDSQID
jgi:hypothetical protein